MGQKTNAESEKYSQAAQNYEDAYNKYTADAMNAYMNKANASL